MTDIIVAKSADESLHRIETILANNGLPFQTANGDLTDPSFVDLLGDRESGVVIARFVEEDLLSIKAMQLLLGAKPGMGVLFVSPTELNYQTMALLFNEGGVGLLTESMEPEMVLAVVRKGVKRSLWKQEGLAENVELKRLNTRLNERISFFEEEGAREHELRQRLEDLVHFLLTQQGFKAKSFRVLIVSGSAYQKGILSEMFEKIGFSHKAVSNSKEAIPTIKSYEPHVVISDLELVDGSGVELAKEVKGTTGFPPVHFIVMTSNAEKRNWILTPETKVDDCIIKPSDPVKMKDMLSRISLGILTI